MQLSCSVVVTKCIYFSSDNERNFTYCDGICVCD